MVLRKGLLCWWGGRADGVRGGPSWLGPPRASCCPQVIYMARNPKDLVVSYYQFHRSLRTMSYRGTFQEFCRRFMNDKREYPCPGVLWATQRFLQGPPGLPVPCPSPGPCSPSVFWGACHGPQLHTLPLPSEQNSSGHRRPRGLSCHSPGSRADGYGTACGLGSRFLPGEVALEWATCAQRPVGPCVGWPGQRLCSFLSCGSGPDPMGPACTPAMRAGGTGRAPPQGQDPATLGAPR